MKRKVLKKKGNHLMNYPVDSEIDLNNKKHGSIYLSSWAEIWKIWKTIYDSDKDYTYIYLER